jgi:hypothetical protein
LSTAASIASTARVTSAAEGGASSLPLRGLGLSLLLALHLARRALHE